MNLIFHADDFGLSPGVNRAIIRAYHAGLLTSASLLAGGEAAAEAIGLAVDNPGLDMGIHLTLCDERAVLSPRELRSLVPKGGRLPPRRRVMAGLVTRRIDYRQVESEWKAQIETCTRAGIRVSHMDSHQYVHILPGLFRLCLRLAEQYNIPFVRTSNLDRVSPGAGCGRLIQWIGLTLYVRWFIHPRVPAHIKSIPSIGVLKTGGRLDRDSILKTLDAIEQKNRYTVIEIILHPGTGDEQTRKKYQHWGYDWQKDLELLLDPELAGEIERKGFTLTAYGELG